jgi:hypothetical protein
LTNFIAQVVLVADPLYDDDHPDLLADAIHNQLCLDDEARAVVMVPLRDETTKRLLASFREQMSSQPTPFRSIEEGTTSGQDDWDEDDREDDSETTGLQCWWGVFQRQQ